jgi:hypothetical protein
MGILLVPRLGGLSTTPISAYFFKKSTTVEVASFASNKALKTGMGQNCLEKT